MTTHTAQFRSPLDRVRHTLLFEIGLLLLLLPLGSVLFDKSAAQIGMVAVALSLLAMVWNGMFNFIFDRWLCAVQGHCDKSMWQRVVHAVLFELGLVVVSVPILAVTLDLTLWEALLADIGFIVLALGYAMVFNLAYDKVFPIARAATAAQAHTK